MIETQFEQADSRGLWQSMQIVAEYKPRSSSIVNAIGSLVNDLNIFYSRFEASNVSSDGENLKDEILGLVRENEDLVISEMDVRTELHKFNIRKACGPDNIPGRVLKVCANQLAPVFTTIFNLSFNQGVVPISFKSSIIIPVPKTPCPGSLNDYHPVALTSVVMKCFERLVRDYICSSLPCGLDRLQFAYRPNSSKDDAINYT